MTENSDDELEIMKTIMQLLKPLEQSGQNRIIQTVNTYYGLDWGYVPNHQAMPIAKDSPMNTSQDFEKSVPYSESEQLPVSPKDFLMEKMPQSDMERVACLAYYITHYREQPYFKNLDLDKLNTEAAQPRFSNLSKSAGNALTNHYLAAAPTKGMKQISAHGEAYVRALPDRAAARNTMRSKPRRKNTKAVNKKKVTPNG